MKNQQWRRELRSYGFVHTIHSRYADIDTLRHVNNIAVHGMHAEACMRFQLLLLGETAWQSAASIPHPVQVETDFLQITHYRSPVQCGVRLIEVSERECILASGLFQDGVCVGIQEQRVVLPDAGRAIPFLDAARLSLSAHGSVQHAPAPLSTASRSRVAPDIGAYPFVFRLTVRILDLDADQCYSTLALLRYAEQARLQIQFPALDHAGIELERGEVGTILARTGMHILRRRAAQGEIRLATGVSRMGKSSFALRVAVFDQQGCVADSEAILVCIRHADGRSTQIPQKLRDYLVERAYAKV